MNVVQPVKKLRRTKQLYVMPLRGYKSLLKLNNVTYKGKWLMALYLVIILSAIFSAIGIFTLI